MSCQTSGIVCGADPPDATTARAGPQEYSKRMECIQKGCQRGQVVPSQYCDGGVVNLNMRGQGGMEGLERTVVDQGMGACHRIMLVIAFQRHRCRWDCGGTPRGWNDGQEGRQCEQESGMVFQKGISTGRLHCHNVVVSSTCVVVVTAYVTWGSCGCSKGRWSIGGMGACLPLHHIDIVATVQLH